MKLDHRIEKELMHRAAGNTRARFMWSAYIEFLECSPELNPLPKKQPGSSLHHILWRSEYPQYVNSSWNWIRLSHEDHTAAAALMLAAESENIKLYHAFNWTKKIERRLSWKPETKKGCKELLDLYLNKRRSIIRIAKKFGVSLNTIRRFLIREGVIRGRGVRRPYSISLEKKICSFYSDKNYILLRLKKKFHIDEEAIRRMLLRSGIEIRTSAQRGFLFKQWRPKNHQKVVELYFKPGGSLRTVAKKYGVCRATIYAYLKRHSIRLKPPGRHKH